MQARNSEAELRWKYGSRKVFVATSQRGPNHKKSHNGVSGSRDLAVRTVKIDGSVWSIDVLFWDENLVRSYL